MQFEFICLTGLLYQELPKAAIRTHSMNGSFVRKADACMHEPDVSFGLKAVI